MSTETPNVLPEPVENKSTEPLLTDKQYLWFKNVAMVILPAVGAFYFGLAMLWGFPGGEQVVGTCSLLATFLGVIVKLGEHSYDKSDASNNVGTIRVNSTEDGTQYQLDLGDHDPSIIDRSGKVVFDVDSDHSGGH